MFMCVVDTTVYLMMIVAAMSILVKQRPLCVVLNEFEFMRFLENSTATREEAFVCKRFT